MDISTVRFPLFKLRSYLEIEHKPLGLVKVTTIKGTYILDDLSLPGNLEDRRIQLYGQYTDKEIYKLKEKVLYLRQLVKYKSGTTFIDVNGKILKYKKSSKLYKITSKRVYLSIEEHL